MMIMIRVITAILLGLAAVAAIWWLPANVFDLIVFAAVVGSLFEFSRMFITDVHARWALIAAGTAVALCMIFFAADSAAMIPIIVLALFALACFFMWRAQQMEGVVAHLGISVLGIIYLAVALSLWSWLRHVELGREWVMMILVPSCLCDTFAFLAGKAFGRHKLAPLVSPNKTVEGFFGALVGSLVGTFMVWALLLRFVPWYHALVLSLIIWIVSPLGDLIESMVKRSAGVKDSGTIIPGHGGLLDRLDALTFAGPVAYIYVKYILSF